MPASPEDDPRTADELRQAVRHLRRAEAELRGDLEDDRLSPTLRAAADHALATLRNLRRDLLADPLLRRFTDDDPDD
jgi:hypothetical protein